MESVYYLFEKQDFTGFRYILIKILYQSSSSLLFYLKMKFLRLNTNIFLRFEYQIKLEYICKCNGKSQVAGPNHFYGKTFFMLPAKRRYKLYQTMFHHAHKFKQFKKCFRCFWNWLLTFSIQMNITIEA